MKALIQQVSCDDVAMEPSFEGDKKSARATVTIELVSSGSWEIDEKFDKDRLSLLLESAIIKMREIEF